MMKQRRDTIEQLRLDAGRLWDDPVPDDGQREELLTELIAIEHELESLGLRIDQPQSNEDEIDRCAERLDRLRCRWAVAA